jgi:hypothetical protein
MAAAKPKNKGLGRGLDSLFADHAPVYNPVKEETAAPAPTADGNAVVYININDIKPNEGQPRKTFVEEKLNELGKKGWKVFHIERMNKDNYYSYPKAIYYLIKETDENIIITK